MAEEEEEEEERKRRESPVHFDTVREKTFQSCKRKGWKEKKTAVRIETIQVSQKAFHSPFSVILFCLPGRKRKKTHWFSFVVF